MLVVENVIELELVPLQITWSEGWFTSAVGFTVMSNVWGVPVQITPLFVNNGVTDIVATWLVEDGFNKVNVGIEPEPLVSKPMLPLVFVHSNEDVPPVLVVAKLIPNESPSHTTCELKGVTLGAGFTITSIFFWGPVHPLIAGKVNTYRTLIGPKVVFVKVSDIVDVPEVPDCEIPATVALVHPIAPDASEVGV